eukprot:TCALIF_00192-PA protein Name:"Protein of unknown function" AED:0.33 eAED:0.33 QI:0/-1/0/1/-1/1/1/0/120
MIPSTFPILLKDKDTSIKLVQTHEDQVCMVDKVINEFQDVFNCEQGLRPMNCPPMIIHLPEDIKITPTKVLTSRPIPYAIRGQSKDEVQNLLRSEIIEPLLEPTEWTSLAMFLPKPDGSV